MAAHPQGKTAVICGAGPIGALTSILLAQQGWTVKVYEKSALPQRPSSKNSRAYTMNLNKKAVTAFKLANVDLADIIALHNGQYDRFMVTEKGKIYAAGSVPVPPTDPLLLRVFRDEIARHLIEEAKRLHPAAVTFHFSTPVTGLDFEQQFIFLTDKKVHYDLLIGADGVNSIVKAGLQARLPAGFVRRIKHGTVYTVGPCLADAKGELPQNTFIQFHCFAEGKVLLMGRGDGDNRVLLLLLETNASRLRDGDKKWLLQHVIHSMPRLPSCARQAVKDLLQDPPEFHPISGWTYLSQLHGPKAVLLGDAAHTMTPVLGQGCNSGLEDAMIFARMLQQSDGDLDSLLPAYSAARLPELRALISINELATDDRGMITTGNDLSVRHRLWLYSHSRLLKLHMAMHMPLHKIMPKLFAQPALFSAMMGVGSFRAVQQAMYWDLAVLAGIGAALLAAGYSALLHRQILASI